MKRREGVEVGIQTQCGTPNSHKHHLEKKAACPAPGGSAAHRAGQSISPGHLEAQWDAFQLLCLGGWGLAVHFGFENKSTQMRGG